MLVSISKKIQEYQLLGHCTEKTGGTAFTGIMAGCF